MTTQIFREENNKNIIIIIVLLVILFLFLSAGAYAYFWKLPQEILAAHTDGYNQAVSQLTNNEITSDQLKKACTYLPTRLYSKSDSWDAAAAAKFDLEKDLKCKSGVSRIILKGDTITRLYYLLVFIVEGKTVYVVPFNGKQLERIERGIGLWTANGATSPGYDDTIIEIGAPMW